ncbi:hypothetical protein [Roseinatronobacter sp. S2]|uniref:hypothetical protein n=1 Tax=Roseinatronobacter sp. S2 TaxID=3035471 RepID=UPI00240FDF92|nr:hypothetical protein [Roseinatronobacter sp. S2]WFE76091.1 hypothetical protein P8S53_06740 [Roseinatronobacter sp. S2]
MSAAFHHQGFAELALAPCSFAYSPWRVWFNHNKNHPAPVPYLAIDTRGQNRMFQKNSSRSRIKVFLRETVCLGARICTKEPDKKDMI